MKQEFNCQTCGNSFEGETIDDCPACAQHFASLLLSKRPSTASSKSLTQLDSDSHGAHMSTQNKISTSAGTTMTDLVNAQNRTTAAVRSMAVFFFVNLTSSLIAAVLIWMGYGLPAPWMVVTGLVVVIAGFVLALAQGLSELKHSN
jgi:Flp pilus assembly protein TadB